MVREPSWARRVDDGWLLDLRVQPGARRCEVVGALGSSLKIRVRAPADGGKANVEVVRFLAERLGVPRRSVRIVRGQSSRTKTVYVGDSTGGQIVLARLAAGG